MIVSLIKLSSLIKKVIFQCIADFVSVPFQPCLRADVSYFLCCTKEIGDVCTQAIST